MVETKEKMELDIGKKKIKKSKESKFLGITTTENFVLKNRDKKLEIE